ncbi:MAG: SDR family oxidoreductase [Candidatus Moduliflexus flocculans]|nr:SDR family oxidoreductase [Candidatus Moduliflexus flocculans]
MRVFEVRPGIIQTDMTVKVKDKYDKLIHEGLVPQKRWGLPEDVGKAVASIARGDWDFSTGMIFEISGGTEYSQTLRHLQIEIYCSSSLQLSSNKSLLILLFKENYAWRSIYFIAPCIS